jgi:transcription elongation factor GreB
LSKAFTKDDSAAEVLVVPRAPLPAGSPNYVTARGLRKLRAERDELEAQRAAVEATDPVDRVPLLNALTQRLAELQARISTAHVVVGSNQPQDEVRFGATVVVRNAQGKDCAYQIVGVDEADAGLGLVTFTAPLARALLGKRVADVVELRTPKESAELEVRSISYGEVDAEL